VLPIRNRRRGKRTDRHFDLCT